MPLNVPGGYRNRPEKDIEQKLKQANRLNSLAILLFFTLGAFETFLFFKRREELREVLDQIDNFPLNKEREQKENELLLNTILDNQELVDRLKRATAKISFYQRHEDNSYYGYEVEAVFIRPNVLLTAANNVLEAYEIQELEILDKTDDGNKSRRYEVDKKPIVIKNENSNLAVIVFPKSLVSEDVPLPFLEGTLSKHDAVLTCGHSNGAPWDVRAGLFEDTNKFGHRFYLDADSTFRGAPIVTEDARLAALYKTFQKFSSAISYGTSLNPSVLIRMIAEGEAKLRRQTPEGEDRTARRVIDEMVSSVRRNAKTKVPKLLDMLGNLSIPHGYTGLGRIDNSRVFNPNPRRPDTTDKKRRSPTGGKGLFVPHNSRIP